MVLKCIKQFLTISPSCISRIIAPFLLRFRLREHRHVDFLYARVQLYLSPHFKYSAHSSRNWCACFQCANVAESLWQNAKVSIVAFFPLKVRGFSLFERHFWCRSVKLSIGCAYVKLRVLILLLFQVLLRLLWHLPYTRLCEFDVM